MDGYLYSSARMLLFCLFLIKFVAAGNPVQLIIDTDLGFDVDDAGAIAVGNHLSDMGYCEILGIVHNTGFYYGIGGVDVITNYYGRNYNTTYFNLGAYTGPWGSSSDAQNNQNKYTTQIEKDYPSNIQNYDQVPSAVNAYKSMLSRANDNSVVIASIGELTNLRDIINSSYNLFTSKVTTIYYMDGSYNFGCGDSDDSGWSPYMGSTDDCYGAAQFVIDNIPTSIKQVFTLNGGDVNTGGRFNGNDGCGQGPVKEAYQIWTNDGTRPSWDPITVYLSVMGDTSLYSSLQAGTNSVNWDGDETFDTSNTNNNQYHVWTDSSHDGDITRIIDDALCAAPCLAPDNKIGGCSNYQINTMKNCYDGHGATNLEHPTDASAGTMSLYNCLQLCSATQDCDGISVSNNETSVPGYINCYRKANIDIDECDSYIPYDTYTRIE